MAAMLPQARHRALEATAHQGRAYHARNPVESQSRCPVTKDECTRAKCGVAVFRPAGPGYWNEWPFGPETQLRDRMNSSQKYNTLNVC